MERKCAFSTAFTFANSFMGCALLSLGYAFSRMGWVIGAIILILFTLFELIAYYRLVDVSHFEQVITLRKMMQNIFNKKVAYFLDFTFAFCNFGYLIVYVSIYADYMYTFIYNVTNGKEFKQIYLKLIIVPVLIVFSLIRSMDAISKISAFTIILIFVAVIAIVVYWVIFLARGETEMMKTIDGKVVDMTIPFPKFGDTAWPANKNGWYAFLEVIQRIPLYAPLYGAQASVPAMYHDLEGPPNLKRKAMRKGSLYSIVFSGVLYMLAAFCSCTMFGTYLEGNVLMSFRAKNVTFTIVRFLYTLVVLMSYIVMMYPVRSIILEWMHLDPSTSKKGLVTFYVLGIVMVFISVALSIAIPNIVTVIDFIASIFGISLYWVTPILAIWVRPRAEANSTVPTIDDDEEIDDAANRISRISLRAMVMEQRQNLVTKAVPFTRLRSRSEISKHIVRRRASSYGDSSTGALSDKNSYRRRRASSISTDNPAHANDIAQDIANESGESQSKPRSMKEVAALVVA